MKSIDISISQCKEMAIRLLARDDRNFIEAELSKFALACHLRQHEEDDEIKNLKGQS